MATAFISDCHLSDNSPEMTQLFCQFLADCSNHADALYILGDFFDVWIGDDYLGKTEQTIIAALQQSRQKGLPIYLMHGNRDFLIGKRFLKNAGCTFLPDETVANLYGKPVLLMHGDTLCTADIAYLKFRRWSRCWFIKKLFLMKSLQTRAAIAARYRKASMAHTADTAPEIMDVTPPEVEKKMKKHQVQTLIHGHTHRPAVHTLSLNNQPAERIVLPAWHQTGGALLFQPDGTHTLVTFQPKQYRSLFDQDPS